MLYRLCGWLCIDNMFMKKSYQISFMIDCRCLFYFAVLEYVDGKWVWEGSGPPGGIGEKTARNYLRDIVSGLMYLHSHV
uniref:Uncharacterized protein MANES_11G144200 n=1 Tax=Rhizophora mucronata TaxID=61149 RepID=A0A2P2M1J7_RHIMU